MKKKTKGEILLPKTQTHRRHPQDSDSQTKLRPVPHQLSIKRVLHCGLDLHRSDPCPKLNKMLPPLLCFQCPPLQIPGSFGVIHDFFCEFQERVHGHDLRLCSRDGKRPVLGPQQSASNFHSGLRRYQHWRRMHHVRRREELARLSHSVDGF